MAKFVNLDNHGMVRASFISHTDSLASLLSQANKFGTLTREEEIKLAERVQNGDEKAFEEFVQKNLLFVIKCARHYGMLGVPLEDLIQYGNIGLCKAVREYTNYKEYKFSSFAVHIIRKSISDAIEETGDMVRRAHDTNVLILKIKKATELFEMKYGETPTDEDLADIIKTSVKKIKMAKRSSSPISSMDKKSEDDSDSTFGDTVSGDMNADKGLEKEDKIKMIESAISCLNDRAKMVIKMSFGIGFDFPCSNGEISSKLGICETRVQQIINESISKMRKVNEKK